MSSSNLYIPVYCISDGANKTGQPPLRLGQPVLASVPAGSGGEELALLSPGAWRFDSRLRCRAGHAAGHSGCQRPAGGAQQRQ